MIDLDSTLIYKGKYRLYHGYVFVPLEEYDSMDAEILLLQEKNRKLREAVKVERAMRHQYFLEEDIDMMVDAWNHCGNKIREECLMLAESELRVDGVIE